MDRYWVFAYDYYYPNGGFNDFNSSHTNIDDATKVCRELTKIKGDFAMSEFDNAHIIDIKDGSLVERFRRWR